MSDNIVQLNTELIHSELRDLVKNSVEETLNAMLVKLIQRTDTEIIPTERMNGLHPELGAADLRL